MYGRICDYKIEEIELLSEEGCNGKEISLLAGVSHSTALRYSNRKGETETDYRKKLLQKKGEKSLKEHQDRLAQEKGYINHREYANKLNKEKIKREPYQKLSKIVKERTSYFIEQGKYRNQTDVVESIGFSRQTFSKILNGHSFPKNIYLERLCSGLDLNIHEIARLLEKK